MSKILEVGHYGYAEKGKTGLPSISSDDQLKIYSVKLMNGSGSSINVGIYQKLTSSLYDFYQVVAASTPDATLSNDIKSGTATALFTTTNDDGYLIQSKHRFGMIGFNVSTAASGGSPVYTYQYWNGSSYATLTTVEAPAYGSGTNVVIFNPPQDWAKGSNSDVGGDTASYYSVLVRATTASGTAGGSANALWLAAPLAYQEALADNGTLSVAFPDTLPLLLGGGEAIIPYFGTANAANAVSIVYQTQVQ